MNVHRIRFGFLLVALIVLPPDIAFAHGTGAIALSTKQAAPGASITIFGTEFVRNSSVRLELRGTLDKVVFGRVQASEKGIFQEVVTIPAASKPGQYNIVAVAPDGDVVAQAMLMIAVAAASQETHPGMHDMPGMQGMGGPHATRDMMDVEIPITPSGWAVIAAIVLGSAAGGVWLLRAGRRTQAV